MSKKIKMMKDTESEAYVLGSIIHNPNLLNENEFNKIYFSEPFTQIIYSVCNNMFENGITEISSEDIYRMLEDFPKQKKIFEDNNGLEFIKELKEKETLSNFTYHYERLKKSTYLRELQFNNIGIEEYFDAKDEDENLQSCQDRQSRYLQTSLGDMMDHYQSVLLSINNKFSVSESKIVKAGSKTKFRDMLKLWKAGGAWGLPFQSKYLTAMTRGMHKKRFYIVSAGSGTGKSRTALSLMASHYAVELYDTEAKKWIENKVATSQKGGALYLQYEMDIDEELMPIMISTIAAVPQEVITDGRYSDEIAERIEYAIDVLDRSNIFLGEVPDFTVREIDNKVGEYVKREHITSVYFDYIDQSPSLTKEYIEAANSGLGIRDDLVLKNFSKKLKKIGKKWNVSMYTSTQISGDTSDPDSHGYNLIANSKAIVNSADFHALLLRISDKEQKKLEPILEKVDCMMPTHEYLICKNRGAKYVDVRVFLYIDFATMRVTDLFCTTKGYELLPDVPKISINYIGETNQQEVDKDETGLKFKEKKSKDNKGNKTKKKGFGSKSTD